MSTKKYTQTIKVNVSAPIVYATEQVYQGLVDAMLTEVTDFTFHVNVLHTYVDTPDRRYDRIYPKSVKRNGGNFYVLYKKQWHLLVDGPAGICDPWIRVPAIVPHIPIEEASQTHWNYTKMPIDL